MDTATRQMVLDAYEEAAQEALDRGLSVLTAHKEAVIAAAMLLSAITGVQDEEAKQAVVALNARPGLAGDG